MMRMLKLRSQHHFSNIVASAIFSAAIGILYFSFDPSPADADPNDMAVVATKPVPIPVIAYKPVNVSEQKPGDQQGPGQRAPQQNGTLTGRMALLMNMLLLEKGCRYLETVPDYTATFSKQEFVGGTLSDNQVINLKCRHQPFSVYMKWLVGDKGQELLYVDGQNEEKMLVKMGGLKGRLVPTLKLDPLGSLAMQESRYPITKAGIKALAETIIDFRKKISTRISTPNASCCRIRNLMAKTATVSLLILPTQKNRNPIASQSSISIKKPACRFLCGDLAGLKMVWRVALRKSWMSKLSSNRTPSPISR